MNISVPTLVASVATSAVTGGIVAAGFVNLQDASPGTPDTGHINVTGNVLAGKFGSGVDPTLARVQVKETGGLQGVRAESGSGVAVFGKSTAASGLGAGGYFTSSSVGGRGIVGDALSSTGNTVGGLFYNRSTGGGVAVWGRAIGAGTATGVFGEATASTGRGGAFSNGGSNTSVSLATADAAIEAEGDIRRDIAGTMESMVPIGYGWVASNGTKVAGTGGWTSSYNGSFGWYEISFTGKSFSLGNGDVVMAVPAGSTERQCGGDSVSSKAIVIVTNESGTRVQQQFLFIAYARTGGTAPPFSAPVPPGMTDSEWIRRYPKQAQAHMARVEAWRASRQSGKYAMPDQGPNP